MAGFKVGPSKMIYIYIYIYNSAQAQGDIFEDWDLHGRTEAPPWLDSPPGPPLGEQCAKNTCQKAPKVIPTRVHGVAKVIQNMVFATNVPKRVIWGATRTSESTILGVVDVAKT